MTKSDLERAAALLARAHSPIVFTGAGVSQESGIPTFRDALTGLWEKFDPMDLATPEAFERDPKLVWDFYEYRRDIIRGCKPNAAHQAIARLDSIASNPVVITQNVDGFHQAAGSGDVITLHGNIFDNRCMAGCEGSVSCDELSPATDGPPLCAQCRTAFMRPGVVWFGEELAEEDMVRATAAVFQCDLMILVGTSGLVYPAASFPEWMLGQGRPVIEINPEPTSYSESATIYFQTSATEVLPRLIEKLL